MLLASSILCILGATLVVAQTNPNCPRNWSYLVKTNKCYQVFGFGTDGVSPLVWTKAEEYCNGFNGGHLASFDSEEEITFVVKLTHSNRYDDGGPSSIHIGLEYSGAAGWVHPDGSSLDYLRWYSMSCVCDNTELRGQYPAGILQTRRYWTGYMDVAPATTAFPFVCQATPLTNG